MVRPFNQEFIDEAIGCLHKLEGGAKPQWGRMNVAQMIAHIRHSVRYSLEKETRTENVGGLLGRVAAPLILNGVIKIPKNQDAPSMYDTAPEQATADELRTELEEFLARYQAGFRPPAHPYFGEIGAAGWGKMHIVHLEHHLRQFGVCRKKFVQQQARV